MAASLKDLMDLAHAMIEQDDVIDGLDAQLKAAKEVKRMLQEESIPMAMKELEIESFTLDTGEKLKVSQEVYASIPADRKMEAYAWLDDNGFGGLLKLSLSLQYGKGEKDEAVQLFKELSGRGLVPDLEEGVHAQTLKAFLKEQIAAGTVLPLDLFGARPVFVAKITKK